MKIEEFLDWIEKVYKHTQFVIKTLNEKNIKTTYKLEKDFHKQNINTNDVFCIKSKSGI